ncbi:MAG: sensor histidine kinase [Candidatus Eiseniibacteriota bacterium]|nr:MAG: sensor histidine kinase [Candidatus Eisenbacteria bacterium]
MKPNWLWKVIVLAAIISVTLATHYGWLGHNIWGHTPLMEAIHARLCYIPIVIAAVWFGLRGGLLAALAISLLLIPYVAYRAIPAGRLSAEMTELVFYFAIGFLAGALVERERSQRAKMEKANARLEQAHRLSMMGEMAAGVAHEIKNPIASIKGATEILAQDLEQGSPKREFADIVRKEISRLDGTVRSFLDFARPQPFRFSLEAPGEILESTLKQMRPQIERASLKLEATIPEFTEQVRTDPQKLRQVFINLLLNAVAATPPGGKISVELGQRRTNRGRRWTIGFSDTGSGIAPENFRRVFEPFFTEKSSGSGLGLAIVRSIVEEHGGRMEVTSEPGQGSAFTVMLPVEEK